MDATLIRFLGNTIKTAVGSTIALGFPTIVPASVFGKYAPSNLINVASIVCGGIYTTHDMTMIARYAGARIVAVCDLDKDRANAGPAAVKANYLKAAQYNGGLKGDWDVKVHYDYREMLKDKGIDAVHISLPDHQHAIV